MMRPFVCADVLSKPSFWPFTENGFLPRVTTLSAPSVSWPLHGVRQVRPRPRPFQTLLSPGTLTTRPTMLAPKAPKPPPMLRLRVFHWSTSCGTSAAGTSRARATVPPTLTKASRPMFFSASSEKSLDSTLPARWPGASHAGSESRPLPIAMPSLLPPRLMLAPALPWRLTPPAPSSFRVAITQLSASWAMPEDRPFWRSHTSASESPASTP